MVLLRRALEQQGMVQQLEAASGNRNVGSGEETGVPAHLMSRSAFDEVCRLSHVTNPDAAIDALEQAGIIVALENRTLIHLRPAQYLAEQELVEFLMTPSAASPAKKPSVADTVLPSACVLEEEVLARIQRLASEERAMRSKLTGAMRRATQWGNHRFTLLSLFIASQIAVVARLTFFELDWDTMEPVTYCMTVFTSIVLYSFYLWYHREATCDEFHSTFIARRVRRWAPKDFDWKRYEEVCAQLEEEKRVLEQIREWTSSH